MPQGLLRVVEACAIGIAAHNLLGERVPHPVCTEGEPPLRYFCVCVETTNLDLQSRNLLHIGSFRRAVEASLTTLYFRFSAVMSRFAAVRRKYLSVLWIPCLPSVNARSPEFETCQ